MLDCLLPSFCSLGFARLEGENDSPNEFFIKLVMDMMPRAPSDEGRVL